VSARIGIEIGARTLRAVRLDGSMRPRVRLAEVAYDPDNVAEAVAALRDQLGRASRTALALDLPHLFAKHVKLPPVAAAEKRRMLTLEPERFFPVRGAELTVSARDGDDHLVFATREAPLAAWVAALETLGPIDVIEPAPVALARALAAVGVRSGAVLVDANGDGVGVIELADARVRHVRRVGSQATDVAAAASEITAREGAGSYAVYLTPWAEDRAVAIAAPLGGSAAVRPVPATGRVPDTHLAAFGAALGIGGAVDETLAPSEIAHRIVSRRRRGAALAVAAFAGAIVLAALSLDAARTRTARALERDAAAMRAQAEGVLAMRSEIETLDREARAVAAVEAKRGDPLAVIRALSARLPKDAHVRSLRGGGAEWQVAGFATDASRIVPLLEAAPEFEAVRFLSGTSRSTIGDRMYENFSVTFRIVPAR
jgi:hypothetical protein